MNRYRTPLRYPGGKQKLAPFIADVLKTNDLVGCEYSEPYAGGAGAAMELLLDGLVSRVHLNDVSYPIYAFWASLKRFPDELCRRISRASLTIAEWQRHRAVVRAPKEHDVLELGFSTLYLNRCNRSGVLTGGLIGGLSQDGPWKMDARFPRKELTKRVEAIASRAHRIRLRNWDAERFLLEYLPGLPTGTFVYCDPPYYEKASRLYLNSYKTDDHSRIASIIQRKVRHRWMVSYDAVQPIISLYASRRSLYYALQYNAAKVYRGKEVIFFSDRLRLPNDTRVSFLNEPLANMDT